MTGGGSVLGSLVQPTSNKREAMIGVVLIIVPNIDPQLRACTDLRMCSVPAPLAGTLMIKSDTRISPMAIV